MSAHRVAVIGGGYAGFAAAVTLAASGRDVTVFVADQPVMDAVVGFHIHRGVLAVGRRLPLPDPEALLAEARCAVTSFSEARVNAAGGQGAAPGFDAAVWRGPTALPAPD